MLRSLSCRVVNKFCTPRLNQRWGRHSEAVWRCSLLMEPRNAKWRNGGLGFWIRTPRAHAPYSFFGGNVGQRTTSAGLTCRSPNRLLAQSLCWNNSGGSSDATPANSQKSTATRLRFTKVVITRGVTQCDSHRRSNVWMHDASGMATIAGEELLTFEQPASTLRSDPDSVASRASILPRRNPISCSFATCCCLAASSVP